MVPRDPRRGSFFDLSDRTKIRLTGSDRLRFINGQITNDVRRADDSTAIAACVLSAKGKLNGFVFISTANDDVFLDGDAALNDTLLPRLDRYIIADDVQAEIVTSQFALFHVIGGVPPPDLAARVISANRFAMPGFDVWSDASAHDQVAASLSTTFPLCDSMNAEVFRIEQGVPAWGAELTEDIIPVEANLEEGTIDYHKGCYIGQEVISRMKMSGQRNKSLCGLISISQAALTDNMKLHPAGDSDKDVGWITSAVWSDRLGKQIALGYVKRPFNQTGVQLQAHSPAKADASVVAVEVVDLPFPDLSSES